MAELCDRAEAWVDPKHNDGGEIAAPVLVADEIAPTLHRSPVTASMKVYRAQQIAHRLPATLAAYGRGDLDLGRVLAIDDATCDLDPTDAAKVECLALPDAPNQTAAELRAALRRAVITVDPKAAEKRRKAAIRGRGVTRYQRRDGTSAIEAVLSALDTGEIYELVDEVARRSKTTGDSRTMGPAGLMRWCSCSSAAARNWDRRTPPTRRPPVTSPIGATPTRRHQHTTTTVTHRSRSSRST